MFLPFLQNLGFDADQGYWLKTNFLRNAFLKKSIDSKVYKRGGMFVCLSVSLFVCSRYNILFCSKGTYNKYHVINTAHRKPHIILTDIINRLHTVFTYIFGCQGLVIVNL